MRYAQFFRKTTNGLAAAIGSDSVFILDGRWGLARCHREVITAMRRRGFIAYQLVKGETFIRSSPITNIIEPSLETVLDDSIPEF